MDSEDEKAALQAIRDHAGDRERGKMMSLFKEMLPDKRKDFWHGLTPIDLVDTLRSRLESGGYASGLHGPAKTQYIRALFPFVPRTLSRDTHPYKAGPNAPLSPRQLLGMGSGSISGGVAGGE